MREKVHLIRFIQRHGVRLQQLTQNNKNQADASVQQNTGNNSFDVTI